MSLPQITIPAVNIPFDIPTLLHPPLVHFAIAIPVLIVIAEILNLFINGKGVKIITTIMMFLLIVILFGAYLTGTADAKAAINSGFGAIDELKEHKLLGIYIFYGSIFVFLLKLISLGVNKTGFKAFYILVLVGFLASILHQGKEGGELVYEYGANVKAKTINHDKTKVEEKTIKKEQEHKIKKIEENITKPILEPQTKIIQEDENTTEESILDKKAKEKTATSKKEEAENKDLNETKH